MSCRVLLQKTVERSATVLSTDFCPWANRWVYWLKNPFAVLVLALVGSALCGVFLNPWIFALTGLLLLVITLGTVLPWIAIRGITCDVMFDVRRVRFGETALVRLRIRNRWPLPVWGLTLVHGFAASHSADRSLTESDEGIAFARLPGWSVMEYSWPFVARRRGRYPLNSCAEVETSFPFGLFRARRKARVDGHLIVWPQSIILAGLPDAAESQQTEEVFSDRRAGDFGDMLGTRLFREGDSLRRVHWAQTARQQQLIVTERQAPMMSSVRIVLNLVPAATDGQQVPGRTSGSGVLGDNVVVEQCIRAAASLCDSLHRQHCHVEFQLGTQQFSIGASSSGLQSAFDALAVSELTVPSGDVAVESPQYRRRQLHQSEFSIIVTPEAAVRPGRSRQVVICDSSAPGTRSASPAESSHVSPGWIRLGAEEPLSQLAAAWREVCHD